MDSAIMIITIITMVQIGIIINVIGALLMVRGHPYISHWCFLIADPLLMFYSFFKHEYEMMFLYWFYTMIAIKGILYYHGKIIKEGKK
jgi:nicotinamide riboside transporter PnuC